MALSPSITRTFRMKPEVDKIFDDLEAWLDHCRLELIDFNPAHLYKSQEYKAWARTKEYHERKAKREAKARK